MSRRRWLDTGVPLGQGRRPTPAHGERQSLPSRTAGRRFSQNGSDDGGHPSDHCGTTREWATADDRREGHAPRRERRCQPRRAAAGEHRRAARASAHRSHRGGTPDRRGAQLHPSRQPHVAATARRLGKSCRGLVDSRRGGRRPRLRRRVVVRSAGAARRRDRLRGGGGHRRVGRGPPVVRRAGVRGVAPRCGGHADPPGGVRRRRTSGCSAWTPCGASSTCSHLHGSSELWTFFPDPWPKRRHHRRRSGRARSSPPSRPAAAARCAVAARDRLGGLRRRRCGACSTPSRGSGTSMVGSRRVGGASADSVRAHAASGPAERSPT